MRFSITTQLALVALTLPTTIEGHTWIELMRNIASNGSFIGNEGYPRGFQSRSDPNFSDLYQTYQIENNHGDNPTLCNPHAQNPNSQGQFARLQASPGSAVSLLYQENGHVTLPDTNLGKPANRGTVYIYATQQGIDGEKYYNVYQKWSADGTGGDKRGKLISTQNFDDGQCFQVNNGAISKQRQAEFKFTPSNPMGSNLWCQNNIVIPNDVDTSKLLTLYWIWKWDTQPGVDPNDMSGKNQTYTSCMDIQLTPSSTSKSTVQFKYSQGQDVQKGGLSSIFNTLISGNVFAVKAYTDGMTPPAANTPISGTTAGSVPTPIAAGSSSSSSTAAAPPPPPNSATTSASSSNCAAVPVSVSVSTETIFVFGTSVGTAAPTGAGVILSTFTGSSPSIATVTQTTVATHTAFVTASSEQGGSTAAVTTASDPSAASPVQSSTAVVSQISDGQPQAPGPSTTIAASLSSSASSQSASSTAATTTAPSQASSQSSAAATIGVSTISDNPIVQPVPTASTISFTFQPSSTGTVTFDSSAAATSASALSTTAATGSSTTAAAVSSSTSTSDQAPPPAASPTIGSSSSATGTSASPTFGTPLPSGIGKRCTPTSTSGAKVKRSSKVFVSEQSLQDAQRHAESRSHARHWRGA